jgi:hypothetical protein
LVKTDQNYKNEDRVLKMLHKITGSESLHAGLALIQLDQLFQIGPRAGVIYSWLFKYTQQHTACFTENNWAPHLLRPAMVPRQSVILRLEKDKTMYMWHNIMCQHIFLKQKYWNFISAFKTFDISFLVICYLYNLHRLGYFI